MQDNKRATGRTTRMILEVAEYLIKHPNSKAVIICHNCSGIHWMKGYVAGVLSGRLWDRITYIDYKHWQHSGIGKRNDYFFDHHCFYTDVCNLNNKLEEVMAQLERVNEDYHKYDA